MIGKTVREGAARKTAAVRRAGVARLEGIAETPGLMRLIECIVRLAGGWLISGAVIFGSYAPFTAGFVAVSGGGVGGLASLIGVILGSMMNFGADMAIKYSAVALLVFTANMALKGITITGRKWFAPLMTAAMISCTGVIYVANGGWQFRDIVFCIMETVLAGSSAYFYAAALSETANPEQERQKMISIGAAVCTLLIALSDIRIVDIIS